MLIHISRDDKFGDMEPYFMFELAPKSTSLFVYLFSHKTDKSALARELLDCKSQNNSKMFILYRDFVLHKVKWLVTGT